MRNALRRAVLAAAIGSFALGVGGVFAAPPAAAALCAEGRVWVADSATPAGTCVPLMEQWHAPCSGFDLVPLGYGAGATACVPTPV